MENKKAGFWFLVIGVLIAIILIIIILGIFAYLVFKTPAKVNGPPEDYKPLENPIRAVVFKNTDASGKINQEQALSEGIREFNVEYINYLLLALGVGSLHKSAVGYGNPVVEMNIDNEAWNSEISGGLITKQGSVEEEDLRITMSRSEAVKALMSDNIQSYMKTSVNNGDTRLEMVASKVELASKGYLDLYNNLK